MGLSQRTIFQHTQQLKAYMQLLQKPFLAFAGVLLCPVSPVPCVFHFTCSWGFMRIHCQMTIFQHTQQLKAYMQLLQKLFLAFAGESLAYHQ